MLCPYLCFSLFLFGWLSWACCVLFFFSCLFCWLYNINVALRCIQKSLDKEHVPIHVSRFLQTTVHYVIPTTHSIWYVIWSILTIYIYIHIQRDLYPHVSLLILDSNLDKVLDLQPGHGIHEDQHRHSSTSGNAKINTSDRWWKPSIERSLSSVFLSDVWILDVQGSSDVVVDLHELYI